MKQLLRIIGMVCIAGCVQHRVQNVVDRDEAKRIMQDVSDKNRKYIPLSERDDTLMRQVVECYKSHGTSNELMEAYYLWGSVYRDLHDAPKAMECFLQGINVADTTSKDCRYNILARLYGQKSNILRQQKLHRQNIEALEKAAKYAKLGGDSCYAIDAYWHIMGTHFVCNDYQTIANECWELLQKSKESGLYRYAASSLNTSILANIEVGRIDDACRLMEIYEQESGDVDPKTLESSFHIYYYTKGRLLAAQRKPDSAEVFFRREMRETDWNNRQAAYRGMCEIFQQRGQKDSITKYAVLQCEAVDSDYQAKLSENLQTLHELYDYSRAQEDSHRKELQLRDKQRQTIYMWATFAFVLLGVIFAFFHLRLRYRQQVTRAELELERANNDLAEKKEELAQLRLELEHMEDSEQKKELAREIEEAERATMAQWHTVEEKQEALDRLRRKALLTTKTLRQEFYDTPVFVQLQEYAKNGKIAQAEDYERAKDLLQEKNPDLLPHLQGIAPRLSETEMRTILLLRLGLRKSEVAVLTAHAPSSISSIVNRLFEKINGRRPHNSAEGMEWVRSLNLNMDKMVI